MNDHNGQLKSYIDRLENLEEQKRATAEDTRELLKEAKSNGFDPKALRAVLKLRMEDAEKREKRAGHEMTLQTYMAALGMLADTPLGKASLSAFDEVARLRQRHNAA